MDKPLVDIDILAKRLIVNNSLFLKDKKYSSLSADVSSASSTITVDSIVGFSVDQILLIGDFGNEKSEIIKTHASTTPSGSTITLASNLVFSHNQGDSVTILDWDQVEFSRNTTASADASKVLSTIDIQADQVETVYRDTANTTGYGYVRLKESIGSTFSVYSDVVPYTGWASNQVGYLIDYALNRNNTDFTKTVSHKFCIETINSGLRYIHGKRKKWSRLQVFDYSLGTLSVSEWKITLPSNMWGYSNKSILDVYLNKHNGLTYKDERDWNSMLVNVLNTTLSANASLGATSITLTNSNGFGDTGTVLCEGQTITFSANDTSTGVLTCTALTAGISSGSAVWGGDYQEGEPTTYTIKENYMYIYPIISTDYVGYNIIADYWKETPVVDSDSDTLDISRFDMLKDYLTAYVRWQLKDNGKANLKDNDYILFEKKLDDSIRIEMNTTSQKYRTSPVVNRITY